ncbi:hypothetical protein AgCh_017461 [Apium graveolens]
MSALDRLDVEDIKVLRERSLQQMKKMVEKRRQGVALGYGEYMEIYVLKVFFSVVKASDRGVCQFYCENWPFKRSPGLTTGAIAGLKDCSLLVELNVDYILESSTIIKQAQTLFVSQADTVHTLMISVLTNTQTCLDGLKETASSWSLKDRVYVPLVNATKFYSVSLSLFQTGWVPTTKRVVSRTSKRRGAFAHVDYVIVSNIVVVSQDGTGDFTTIKDTLTLAPNKTVANDGYFVIYVTVGVYEEYVSIPKNNKYIMMIGDEINQIVITGNHSTADGLATFNSAIFAVEGQGFVAVNITFRNTAGAVNHQAVAMRSRADMSTFYSCSFEGYQDTLSDTVYVLHVMKEREKNRVDDLQGMFCDLQSARKESRTNDVSLLEELVNQMLGEWQSVLNHLSLASSFQDIVFTLVQSGVCATFSRVNLMDVLSADKPHLSKEKEKKRNKNQEITEEQVPISEPVVVEDEKVSSQKDTRAHRDIVESDSDVVETAKEGDQESLISTEAIVIETLPSTQHETAQDKIPTPHISPIVDPVHTEELGTSAEIDIHNLIVPEVLYLEAPPIQLTPPTTSILDVDQNLAADQNLEDDVEASIASHTAVLSEDADTSGSTSSDADNEETIGEVAANLDADAAGPSGHAPQQTITKADLVKKIVIGEVPVPWSETHRGKEWTKEWNTISFVPSEKILAEHLAKVDEMLINDDFKAQLRVTALSTRHLQGQYSTTHAKGNSNKGRGQGQGKGFSSSKARITSQGTSSDTGRRISSDTGKRISSAEHLELDKEISKQLFLKENPGMDFESLKEEEARLKAEGVKTKSKASVVEKKFPKPKGIVIKQRTSSEATKVKSQVEIDPRSKGKEKVDEPVKVFMLVMDEEIIDEEEDVNLTLMQKKIFQTTSDIAHTATSGFEARVVTGKEARDKSGLGSSDERRVHNSTNDPTSLSEPDGMVYQIKQNVIPLKYFEELEHVLFLLQVKDRLTDSAAGDHKGDIVEMKPNSAKIITTFLGYKTVEFNLESDKVYLIRLDQEIRKAKINDLRATIFQTGEDRAELINAKRRMVNELEYAERCLLKNYLRATPDIKEIRN